MNMKKNFLLLFAFVMIFSFFVTVNPYTATTESVTGQNGLNQANSCPLFVKGGTVTVPIDLDIIYGVYKQTDFDYNTKFNQSAYNYFDGYSYSNGVINNLNLTDGTAVVVTAHDAKNATDVIMDNFCFNTCPFLEVVGGYVNGTLNFAEVFGVYEQSQYNYATDPTNQPQAVNYFNTSLGSAYVNGQVSGIQLPDHTPVVVTGKDTAGNNYFMDSLCQGGMSPKNNFYGVMPGDYMNYMFTTDSTTKIPFFGLNNGNAKIGNGDSIQVSVEQIVLPAVYKPGQTQPYGQNGEGLVLKIAIANDAPFSTNDSMFFVVPLNEIEALVANGTLPPDPNGGGPVPTLITATPDQVTASLQSPQLNGTIIVDRHHGNLIHLEGTLADPNNNPINFKIELTESVFGGQQNGQAPVWGVQAGDSFKLQFSTDAQGPVPFFDMNNGNTQLSNGDILLVEVEQVSSAFNKVDQSGTSTSSGTGIKIKITVSNQTSFETDQPMFLIMPVNYLEALANGQTDPNSQDGFTLVSSNSTVLIAKASDPNGTGSADMAFDMVHGTIIYFHGLFKDPQGNSIKMNLDLAGSSFADNSNSASSSYNSISTTNLPGFDVITFFSFGVIGLLLKKKKQLKL